MFVAVSWCLLFVVISWRVLVLRDVVWCCMLLLGVS